MVRHQDVLLGADRLQHSLLDGAVFHQLHSARAGGGAVEEDGASDPVKIGVGEKERRHLEEPTPRTRGRSLRLRPFGFPQALVVLATAPAAMAVPLAAALRNRTRPRCFSRVTRFSDDRPGSVGEADALESAALKDRAPRPATPPICLNLGARRVALTPATTPLPVPVSALPQPEVDSHPHGGPLRDDPEGVIDDPSGTVQRAYQLAQEAADRAAEKIRAGVEQIGSKGGEGEEPDRRWLGVRDDRGPIRTLRRVSLKLAELGPRSGREKMK